jgi:hypothetical protein
LQLLAVEIEGSSDQLGTHWRRHAFCIHLCLVSLCISITKDWKRKLQLSSLNTKTEHSSSTPASYSGCPVFNMPKVKLCWLRFFTFFLIPSQEILRQLGQDHFLPNSLQLIIH